LLRQGLSNIIAGGGIKGRTAMDLTFYLVADADYVSGRDLVPLIEAAVRGGVTAVQLRAKNAPSGEFLELARRTAAVLKSRRVPLLINDRVDIALACGAAGVHLGQQDVAPALARKVLAKGAVIGVSVNTPEEAEEAERQGADYVGAGPVYRTATKDTGLPVLGPEGIRRIKDRVRIPVVAIGGITDLNARAARAAGADGIAVVSAILGAPDPEQAARRLKKAMGTPSPGRRT
jgi:thiamine-phosphate pyrophosphorylase